MKVILTNSATAATSINAEFSVEAEYGSVLVRGSIMTLAHHEAGKAEGFTMCPCLNTTLPVVEADENYIKSGARVDDVCVISHIDWDTLGGVLSLTGEKPVGDEWDNVWAFIAHNDENGVHRSHEFSHPGRTMASTLMLSQAMYSWLSLPENRVFAPRDGSSMDATEFIGKVKIFLSELREEMEKANASLCDSCCGDGCDSCGWMGGTTSILPYINAGTDWVIAQSKTEKDSYVASEFAMNKTCDQCTTPCDELQYSGYPTGPCVGLIRGTVLVRSSDNFVNYMYTRKNKTADAVVGFNTQTGSITLSFEDGGKTMNACEIMQDQFGPLAGGHRGIAGTPRGEVFTLEQAKELAAKVAGYY